jgi:hypothetical protein
MALPTYLQDTQVIEVNLDPFTSKNFADLSGSDVVGKFELSDGSVDIFTLSAISEIVYTKYIKQSNGTFISTAQSIGLGYKFLSKDDIFIQNSYYSPDDVYYFFHNKDNAVVCSEFSKLNGNFADDVVIRDKAVATEAVRIDENFIITIKDLTYEDIFLLRDELGDGENKIVFLYENSIKDFIGGVDTSLAVQVLKVPFQDIPETSWTCKSEVNSGGNFMYMSGKNATTVYDSNSINGSVGINVGDVIFSLEPDNPNYTINLRAQMFDVLDSEGNLMGVSGVSGDNGERYLAQTENWLLTYTNYTLFLRTDYRRKTIFAARNAYLPCLREELEVIEQLPLTKEIAWVPRGQFKNITITNTYDATTKIHRLSLFVDGATTSIERDTSSYNVGYTQDNYCQIYTPMKLDYLSVMKYPMESNAVAILHASMNKDLRISGVYHEQVYDYNEINTWFENDEVMIVANSPDEQIVELKVEILTPLSGSLDPTVTIDGLDYTLNDVSVASSSVTPYNAPITLKKPAGYTRYSKGEIKVSYKEFSAVHEIGAGYNLPPVLNSSQTYKYGQKLGLASISGFATDICRGLVVPYIIKPETTIPQVIYVDPEEHLRVANNFNQVFDRIPFIIEDNIESSEMVLWVPIRYFKNYIPVQYGLQDEKVKNYNTYSMYKTISSLTYDPDEYYSVYHFTDLVDNKKILIKDVKIYNAGEIIITGKSDSGSYVREVSKIRFFSKPARYKTSKFDLLMDPLEVKDRNSFINNVKDIKIFSKEITDFWKPVQTELRNIGYRSSLIMAELLQDEFSQVLVGFTPGANTNTYYVKSTDSSEVVVHSSSGKFDDTIDWLAVGRIDTPFIKTGVSKIKTPQKRIKVYFETKYKNGDYRVFVFSPVNSKYYVPVKEKDGFVVESSYLVEDEIAWITVNTSQVINGTLLWKKGIPEGETRQENLGRILEISLNSHRYPLIFNSFGFPNFENTNYSVILSSDSNVNVWYENKQLDKFDIRRSYTGQDMQVHYLVVEANTKWWSTITE